METIQLKINHIVFWWYYKRVPDFFHQWTILKSIDLLRQNYEHKEFVIEGKDNVINSAIRTEHELRNKLSNIKMQLIATEKQIDISNERFGTNFKKASDN